MENFKPQKFRDNLAEEIKKTPKEEREEILDDAKETPEYWIAKLEKAKTIKERNENIDDQLALTPKFLAESLSEVRVHNKPGSLVIEKFRDIAKYTQEKQSKVIESIVPMLDLYKDYPKAIGVILCAIEECAYYRHKVNKEIEFFKTEDVVNIIKAFESRLVGEEAHQISRLLELSLYQKDRTNELLPKYKKAILGYLDAPSYAEILARDVVYEKNIEKINKLLDFYSMQPVREKIITNYTKEKSFQIGLRKLILKKANEKDLIDYFNNELINLEAVLENKQNLNELAKIHKKIINLKKLSLQDDLEWASKDYLRFAEKSGLIKNDAVEDLRNRIKIKCELLTDKLEDQVTQLFGLPNIMKENQNELRKIISEKIIAPDLGEDEEKLIIKTSIDWDERVCNFEVRHREKEFYRYGGSKKIDNLPLEILETILIKENLVKKLKKEYEVDV